MANTDKKAAEVVEKVAEKVVAPVKKVAIESVYSASELADNYKLFSVSREIVVVALRLAKKEKATLTEAKQIIEKFKNKEVK